MAAGPVGELQLREDRRHVVAHRLLGQDQPAGDLVVAVPGGDQVQDLAFPVGELGEDLGRVGPARAGEEVHDPPGHGRPVDGLATGHREDRAHDVVAVGTLEQVAVCTGPHGREHRLVVVVHREHHHADRGMGLRGSALSLRPRPGEAWPGRSAPRPGWFEPQPRAAQCRPQPRRRPRPRAAPARAASRPNRNIGWSSATTTRILGAAPAVPRPAVSAVIGEALR